MSIAANVDIAVASQATLISDIWVGSSGAPRSLRKITQAMDEFCWTPNGQLVYQSTASGNRDLWITQPDGAEQKQLTNDPALDGNPAVTPVMDFNNDELFDFGYSFDSRFLAVTRGGWQHDIVLITDFNKQ